MVALSVGVPMAGFFWFFWLADRHGSWDHVLCPTDGEHAAVPSGGSLAEGFICGEVIFVSKVRQGVLGLDCLLGTVDSPLGAPGSKTRSYIRTRCPSAAGVAQAFVDMVEEWAAEGDGYGLTVKLVQGPASQWRVRLNSRSSTITLDLDNAEDFA